MKRFFLLLLTFCLLLTGCGVSGEADATSVTTTAEETSATAEPTAEPVREASLLDACEAFDDTGALWYIPNAQIEAQQYPTLRSFADNLLMTTNSYISDGSSELTLMLLSAANGEVLQSHTVALTEGVEAQLLGEHIAVCDSLSGTVVVLDESLRETTRYSLAREPGLWFLGTDLDTLYKCSYLSGIRAVSLSTGKELFFLDLADLTACSMTETDVCFTGVDRTTQKCTAFCLDLASGAQVEPPFSGDFFRICRSSGTWLADFYGEENAIAFGRDANACVVVAQEGTFSLLDPLGHLLFTDLDGTLSLYSSEGTFLSSCALPGQYVQSLIWQEELSGYLLLANDGEGHNRLLFWDIGANTDGEDLQTQSLADLRAVPGGTSADASLYERAQALSDRFGVEIRIADQCETEFTNFSCYQVSDYGPVYTGLDILETALSVFPEGFFRQLIYGHIDRVQFQLIGGLTATDGFGGDMSYAAFTDANGSLCRIVLDVYSINTNSVWHELSHAVDRRLAWDAMYRDGALFSEERWLALNPEGFVYSEEYGALRDDIQPEWYSYFVDDYAMTNATEDRARIFEIAIENSGMLFLDAPGRIAKLQYYCDCIRDCFDTTDWQEPIPWEAPLLQYEP
ncbi:MAG: hypothetical protein ACI4V3_01575 [Faecousia sp.]